MSGLPIEIPRVFVPLLQPSRYKGIWGGRGSGKSHFFAERLVALCFGKPGTRALCVREVQKSLKESAKRLIEDKIAVLGLEQHFDCQSAQIITPGGGIIAFTGMQDHTADSVKSYEGFDVAYVEEAQSLSDRSWTLLRPTMRKAASLAWPAGSEIWAAWNPRRKTDPVDVLLRGSNPPPGAIVVRANWSDNPFFPNALDQERRYDLDAFPERYEHVWEGGYATITEGAYYSRQLAEARSNGRIGQVAADPLMQYRCFWDIGTRDATAIWVAQFIGTQIRVLDYYEAVGQPLGAHLNWLRESGYGKALCVLPHDGTAINHYSAIGFDDHIRQAGFDVRVIKNQGKGAALKRIEAARRLFPSVHFNEATCEAGIDVLGWYHERKDEARGVGLGPEHDFSSHGADAFGLLACAYEQPYEEDNDNDEWRETGRSKKSGY